MKPHLKLKTLPNSTLKMWFCLYQGMWTTGVSPESAYNKLADRFNSEMNWAPQTWLKKR